MRSITFALLSWLLQAGPPAAPVTGTVFDAARQPMAGVVVTLKGSPDLAVTDDTGRFSIAVTGVAATVLLFECPGFQSQSVAVTPSLLAQPMVVTLELQKVSYQVVVRAPSTPAPPTDDRYALRPLDVVRTAGTQADLMRALMVLPGVVQVDEGAGLFVRGGDVGETRVLLDGVVVNHPYRYETPTGGFRGAVDPFLTQGVTFTTGGFAAEFGNSLSGIVDLQGMTRPVSAHATVTTGLAGVAAQVADPLGSRGGVRFAVNRATPGLLFSVNPSPQPFDQLPGGWDVAGGAYLDTIAHGSFHLFVLDQADHVGVQLDQDAFTGFLHASSRHALVAASWRMALSTNWTIKAAAGSDTYANGTDVGVFALGLTDREPSARMDLNGRVGAWRVHAGTDADLERTGATGEVPNRGGDFGGVSGTRLFQVAHQDWRDGTFAELTRTVGRVTATVGERQDYFARANVVTFDPRVNASVDLGSLGRLRLAWGMYHQAPSPAYFDLVDGAVSLRPMAATHYILGYETGAIDGAAYFRVEGYAKTYRHLPVQDDVLGFADTGYGWARGVDVYVRRVWHFIDVRASASGLDTRRRWTSSSQDDRFPLPDGTWTPDFDVPYSGQLVANVPLARAVSLATSWRTAAGRPFTPVAGATLTPAGYVPTWGSINSERLPHYSRLDMAVSYLRTFGKRTSAVFFFSVDNITNHNNFSSYAYSTDYTIRRPVPGAAPRSVYVGCSITR